jgi:Fur family peroxide stress response transcriptional regulator
MKRLTDELRKKHLKVTPQRLAIYNYLSQTTSHPNVESIYNALKPDYPSISIATVYKNVASLRDAGLISEINVGEDCCRYDAETKFHPHLVCKKCGTVIDCFFDDNDCCLASVKDKIKKDLDFDIENETLYFYGICSKCRE